MIMATRILSPISPACTEPGAVLLETKRLILRRFASSDAPDLAAAADYPEVAATLSTRFPSPFTVPIAEAYIAGEVSKASRHALAGAFAITVKTDEPSQPARIIGALALKTDPAGGEWYRTSKLGYWVTVPAWGKGYGPEAIRAFVRQTFDTWPELHRIEASVFSGNAQSERLLQKCGFVKEGVRREAAERNGVMVPETMHGLLRSDLEER